MKKSNIWALTGLLFIGQYSVAQRTDSVSYQSMADFSLEQLLNVQVITASKKSQPINEIPASAIVITRQEIQKLGYTSLQDVLNQVTGLYLWDSYHVRGRIDIGVRGFTSSDNIIILVNGVNQVEGMYNEYLLTKVGVPIEAVDRIEVVRGPMSVMYGSGAFFGVINIITNESIASDTTQVSVLYGSNQTWKGSVNGKIRKENLQIGFTGSGSYSDGMDEAYSKMMSDPSKLADWGLEITKGTKGILIDKRGYFNLNASLKNLKLDMTHTEVERGGFLVQPPVSYSPTKRHSTNFMIEYQRAFKEKISIKVKSSYLTTSSLAFYFLNEPNSYFSFGYNSDALESELLAFLKINENLNLTAGASNHTTYYATNPAELAGIWGNPYGKHLTRLAINSSMMSNAVFAQIDLAPINQIRIVGGFRLEQTRPFNYEASGGSPYTSLGRQHYLAVYANTKINFIPNLALLWSPKKNQTLKLLYGEALRNPPLGKITDILFSTGADSSYNFPQLIPSRIQTFELNYSGLIGKNFNLHMSIYHNELTNLISQYFINITDSSTVYYTANKGHIKSYGTELSLTVAPNPKIKIALSGIYQHSENITSGLEKVDAAYSPDFLGYFKSHITVHKKASVFITANYVSGMKADYDYITHTRLGLDTKAFFTMDAGILFTGIGWHNLITKLNVTNVLDKEIHYPATTLNQFADKGMLGFGRRYFITLQMNF